MVLLGPPPRAAAAAPPPLPRSAPTNPCPARPHMFAPPSGHDCCLPGCSRADRAGGSWSPAPLRNGGGCRFAVVADSVTGTATTTPRGVGRRAGRFINEIQELLATSVRSDGPIARVPHKRVKRLLDSIHAVFQFVALNPLLCSIDAISVNADNETIGKDDSTARITGKSAALVQQVMLLATNTRDDSLRTRKSCAVIAQTMRPT